MGRPPTSAREWRPAKVKGNLVKMDTSMKIAFGKNPVAVSLANNHIWILGKRLY